MHFQLTTIPRPIVKDILTHTFPLLLLSTLRKKNNPSKLWQASFGVLAGLVPFTARKKLLLASLLTVLQIFSANLFFFSLGFALCQAHNTKILLSRKKEISRFIVKIEILGWLCGELFEMPKILLLLLAGVGVFSALTCRELCSESEDPLEEMKKRIDSANLITNELRCLSKKKTLSDEIQELCTDHGFTPLFPEVLYLVGVNKIPILFFSFYSQNSSNFVILAIGILALCEWRWEPLAVFLEGESSPLFRVLSTYFSYEGITMIKNILKQG